MNYLNKNIGSEYIDNRKSWSQIHEVGVLYKKKNDSDSDT